MANAAGEVGNNPSENTTAKYLDNGMSAQNEDHTNISTDEPMGHDSDQTEGQQDDTAVDLKPPNASDMPVHKEDDLSLVQLDSDSSNVKGNIDTELEERNTDINNDGDLSMNMIDADRNNGTNIVADENNQTFHNAHDIVELNANENNTDTVEGIHNSVEENKAMTERDGDGDKSTETKDTISTDASSKDKKDTEIAPVATEKSTRFVCQGDVISTVIAL